MQGNMPLKMKYEDIVDFGIDPKQRKQYFDVGIDDVKTKRLIGLLVLLAAMCLPIKVCFPSKGANQKSGTGER